LGGGEIARVKLNFCTTCSLNVYQIERKLHENPAIKISYSLSPCTEECVDV
jgi:hypothetical protein